MARFSYIDPDGKEVEIGGTAQLGSRISLGAVSDTTLLYDGATDKWAPAAEHAIFRELKETLGPASAPPPPPPPPAEPVPPAETPSAAAAAPPGEAPAQPPEPAAPEPEAAAAAAPGVEPAAEEPEPAAPADTEDSDPFDLGMDLTLSDDEGGDEAEAAGEPMDFGAGDLTLADAAAQEEAPSFDLGADALAMEGAEAPAEEEPAAGPPPGDPFEMEQGPAAAELADDEDEEQQAPSFEFDGPLVVEEPEEEEEEEAEDEAPMGMELESPVDQLGVGEEDVGGFAEGSLVSGTSEEEWARADDDFSGGVELEDEDTGRPEPEEEPEPAGVGAAREEGGESEPDSEPGEARARPRPPARKPEKSISIGKLLIPLVVLGAGGWFGAQFFLGGGSGGGEPEVVGPGPNPADSRTVPAALQEPMAGVAAAATAELNGWLDSLALAHGLGERPPEEWLDGIYLAHASQYPGVEEYWTAVADLLSAVRLGESVRFQAAYEAALGSAGVSDDDAAQLRAWAAEDFQWSQFDRDRVYGSLDEVAAAALDLHDLLVNREADIAYELLEAVPADDELQGDIDAEIDRITDGLDDVNALGGVTTERLVGVLAESFRSSLSP